MPLCNGGDRKIIFCLERELMSSWCRIVREFEESFKEEKQMTESVKLTGASSGLGKQWKSIKWNEVCAKVQRLQMRIAKAVEEKRWVNTHKCINLE